MNRNEAIDTMNMMGEKHSPFFFIVDYEANNCWVNTADEAFLNNILFNFKQTSNYPETLDFKAKIELSKKPVPFYVYQKAFNNVVEQLNKGNSYLVNLTFPTPLETNFSLKQIFHASKAKYRLFFQDRFVVFSPETFIKIEDGKIYTFPMKGTIDALLPNAKVLLLNNHKEMAEHATIVDLLRNDLSRVAKDVAVDRFRYVERIISAQKELLQVSSQISGTLPIGFHNKLGNIVFDMLPAGSISGAPKPKTLDIIANFETHQRGFYTGIAGYFDGQSLDSCVLIRYIENENGKLIYKSGGGITSQSDVFSEYNELIDKIYVPIA
jgi:para-aminobenzoate synthetase component I